MSYQLKGEVRHQRKNGCEEQDPAQSPGESRGEDLPAVFAVEFGPSVEFRFVPGLDTGLTVPPGAAAVEVGSDLRGANGAHGRSIAQIF